MQEQMMHGGSGADGVAHANAPPFPEAQGDEGLRLVVVGAGYVGLVSAAGFAEFGHRIVDVDSARIASLASGAVHFFEPRLKSLLAAQCEAGRLAFSTDLTSALRDAELVFIAVGTPSRPDGAADLVAVEGALDVIAQAASQPLTLALKSTVPVGTHQRRHARRAQEAER